MPQSNQKSKLVLFDWNGTTSRTEYRTAWITAAIANAHGYPVNTDHILENLAGTPARAKYRAIAELNEKFLDDQTLQKMMEDNEAFHGRYTNRLTLFPGFTNAVREIRNNGHQVAICTNRGNEAEQALGRLGLSEYFKGRVVSPDMEDGLQPKPAPDILLHAMKIFGSDAEHTIMVGDSYIDLAASGSDIPFIAHVNPYIYPDTDKRKENLRRAGAIATFSNYADLPQIVRELS